MAQKSKRSADCAARCCGELEAQLEPGFFRALSEPRRLEILLHLAAEPDCCTVGGVAEAMPVSVSVVSRHLATLRAAGVLAARRDGKEVRYRVRHQAVAGFLRGLADAVEGCCPDPDRGDENE